MKRKKNVTSNIAQTLARREKPPATTQSAIGHLLHNHNTQQTLLFFSWKKSKISFSMNTQYRSIDCSNWRWLFGVSFNWIQFNKTKSHIHWASRTFSLFIPFRFHWFHSHVFGFLFYFFFVELLSTDLIELIVGMLRWRFKINERAHHTPHRETTAQTEHLEATS